MSSVNHGISYVLNSTTSIGNGNLTTTTLSNLFTRVLDDTVSSTVENGSNTTTVSSALNDTVSDIVNSAVSSTMENGSSSTTISSILNNTVSDIVNSTVSSTMENGSSSTTISSILNNTVSDIVNSAVSSTMENGGGSTTISSVLNSTFTNILNSAVGSTVEGSVGNATTIFPVLNNTVTSSTRNNSLHDSTLIAAFIMIMGTFLLMFSVMICVRSVQTCRSNIRRHRVQMAYLREHGGGGPPDNLSDAVIALDVIGEVSVVTESSNVENRPFLLCQHDHQEDPADSAEQVRPVFRLQGIFPR
ncbi:conserved domain protein [Ehrlichia chaffeensis str. Arkansas]|uniref:Conserved domain protein n=1 Tax=Ehrlichia chaffeensis (strain ATCC CRL-10679 / Arkansas) TaxID=205920 RepID=Q2GHL5_EHRCR|nr:conserved domain protein [Ehrlichia chaffeensis str. Arkansas]